MLRNKRQVAIIVATHSLYFTRQRWPRQLAISAGARPLWRETSAVEQARLSVIGCFDSGARCDSSLEHS